MEKDIIKVNSVQQYNDLFGFEIQHPLVSVVEFNSPESIKNYCINWGVYAMFLKETKGCVINYGKTQYDYEAQTVVSFAPGQISGFEQVEGVQPKSIGLLFHPDFLFRTALAQKIKRYTFFSYEVNEALHLSDEEQLVIRDCLSRIRTELQHPIDKFSKDLIISNIELLLDYCLRFYSRQFITRVELNVTTLSRFEQLLDEYINSDSIEEKGLPNVKYFADKVCLSANYFGDLVKRETGKTAQEYIQLKLINKAKEKLMDYNVNISQIAYSMGFQYPQHFVRFFKRQVGCTPKEFRSQN